jgi:phosphoglycolate phosphatase-like HAD superfamily hydrolase
MGVRGGSIEKLHNSGYRMPETCPTVLALDFDGVICNGLREYFLTAWRAYCDLWQPAQLTPPDGLADCFYRLRPVVESGWEMPLVIEAVLAGISEAEILREWPTIAPQRAEKAQLDASQLAATVDGIRDRWITADLPSWLAEHRFYPGVIERLQALENSAVHPVIISTKEGRFIVQLLEQQGLDLSQIEVFGKEQRQPKHQILRELRAQYINTASFWFVEDRLKTLQIVQAQSDLQAVQLFLADWGYNTAAERHAAEQDTTIQRLSLDQFSQDFAAW